MAASALAFAVMTVLVKLAGQRIPSQEIVLARAIVTLALSWVILRRLGRAPLGTDRRWLFLRGVLGFLGLSCVYYAVTHLPLAEATVLQYLHPVFTALLAGVFLGERLRPIVFASCGLSLTGVVLVTRPAFLFGGGGAELDPFAVLVAVGGAFFSAAAYVVVKRLSRTEHPVVIVLWFPLVAVPASIPTVVPVAVWPAGLEWLVLIGVGIAAQLGQVWLTQGLRHETAARATAVSYLQVLFAAGFGVLLFQEVPTPLSLVGTVLVLLGTLLVAASRAPKEERPSDARA